jgi:hypothetical protein
MVYLGAGAIALGLLYFLARSYAGADPRSLIRGLRYILGIGFVGIGIVLAISGRWGIGSLLVALGVSAIATGRIGPFDLGGSVRTAGSGSTVRSSWFEMSLDHDTGTMNGRILRGVNAGASLDQLEPPALMALRDEIGNDADSLSLLEAYLDRRVPGWRENVEGDEAPRTGGTPDAGPMTDQQAYEILGLAPGAGKAEIRAAHRRLMKRVHPDQGGSTFLAAKINQAKDWLLGKHR